MDEPSTAMRPATGRVLVGVDGSQASLDALTFAGPIAAAGEAELLVACVLPAGTDDAPGRARDEPTARAQVAEWCASRDITAYRALVLEGPAGSTLADAAASHGASLVVVGTVGLRDHSGQGLGSVANLLAHRLDVPFLAIPLGCRWRGLHEIVVGVDGSESALAAIELLTDLPGLRDATVHAVYACQPLSETVGQPLSETARQQALHDLESWTDPLESGTVAVRRLLRDDMRPAPALLSAADEVHADLVVMGAQATNQLTEQRAGSTVFQVLDAATRPTLLVPPPPAGR